MSPKPPFSVFLQGKPQFKAGSLCRSINKSCRAQSTGRKMLETCSSAASWPLVKIDKPDTPGPKTTSLTYFWLISSNVTNYTSYVKCKLSNVHAVFPFIEILANICSLNKPFACILTASAQMFQKQMPQKHVVKKTWYCNPTKLEKSNQNFWSLSNSPSWNLRFLAWQINAISFHGELSGFEYVFRLRSVFFHWQAVTPPAVYEQNDFPIY